MDLRRDYLHMRETVQAFVKLFPLVSTHTRPFSLDRPPASSASMFWPLSLPDKFCCSVFASRQILLWIPPGLGFVPALFFVYFPRQMFTGQFWTVRCLPLDPGPP